MPPCVPLLGLCAAACPSTPYSPWRQTIEVSWRDPLKMGLNHEDGGSSASRQPLPHCLAKIGDVGKGEANTSKTASLLEY